jgi:hypothetical protein
MKRHAALVPLSHDHHHALVEARRLRHAADLEERELFPLIERLLENDELGELARRRIQQGA